MADDEAGAAVPGATGPPAPAPPGPPTGAPLPAPRRGCRRLAIAAAAALLALAVGWRPLARAAPGRLIEAQEPRAADALVVLAGDHRGGRVTAAVGLFQAGWVPRGPFVVSGGPIYEQVTWAGLMRDQAVRLGVPPARILLQDRSETTGDDARRTVPLLRAAGARTVLLVTSPWHSRRAAAEFRAAAPDLTIVSCPSEAEGPEDWWNDPVATRALATEVLKHLWPGPG